MRNVRGTNGTILNNHLPISRMARRVQCSFPGSVSAFSRQLILPFSSLVRSAGGVQARTSAASSETVRYAQIILKSADLCGRIRLALVLVTLIIVLIHTGEA